ncbi:MAG: hypothetical protein K0B05_11170 [Bacteroidales bacterium]|nr:hypothetical protein [Bacteroidales bacterium]
MPKNLKTHILCFDDHKTLVTTGILDDVRKRFSDTSRYRVISFADTSSFLKHMREERDRGYCRVALLGVRDSQEHFENTDLLTMEIRTIDPETGLILLVPCEKTDQIRKMMRVEIDGFIPGNDNAILRIHNTVKRIISEHTLAIYRRRRNISLYVLLVFLILSAVLLLIARVRLPVYF